MVVFTEKVRLCIDFEQVGPKYDTFVKASGKWKRIKPQFLALPLAGKKSKTMYYGFFVMNFS
jgi:hypothetical protein